MFQFFLDRIVADDPVKCVHFVTSRFIFIPSVKTYGAHHSASPVTILNRFQKEPGSFDPGSVDLRPAYLSRCRKGVQNAAHALARQRQFVGIFLELLEDVRLRVVDVPARVILEDHVDEGRGKAVAAFFPDFAGPEVLEFCF